MARSNAWRKPFVTTIQDLSHDGRGVAKVDGKVIFIPGALPGEEVEAQRVSRSKKHETAKLIEILKVSDDRIEPKCASYSVCGGCSMQHLSSNNQIKNKQQLLMENFQRIGKIAPENILEPLISESWGYRRRARLGVRYVSKKSRALVGFREKFTNFITDMQACEVIDTRLNDLLPELSELISSLEIKRAVPQIEASAGDNAIALVFRILEDLNASDQEKFEQFANKYEQVHVYLQRGGLDTILPLKKYPSLTYDLGEGLVLDFEPLDFVQVNAGLNKLMIQRALQYLDCRAGDKVLDLFCGLGNFTFPIAQHVATVVGVEGDKNLVERAQANALKNNSENAKYHVSNLFEEFKDQAWAKEKYDTLLIDPPRAGAELVVQTKGMFGVRRIVYISCHPGSLARDAGILVNEQGFKMTHAGVMDMFPHTSHVESIAVFERD